MPYRALPDSDATLTNAFRGADRKRKGLVAPAKLPFPDDVDAHLTAFLPKWERMATSGRHCCGEAA